LAENVKTIRDIRNANKKRGGSYTLVGGDPTPPDEATISKDRAKFILRALNGNGDGDSFVKEWTEEKGYVLPSWFSFAAALICARDKLLSMIDEAKGINAIPESEDKSIASLVPFMMLISGPPMRPGQIYSARKPGCGAVPSKKENYIQMSYAYVDSDNGGPQEKVYMFHADTSLFKVKKYSRHKAVFTSNFFPIIYHYFFVVLPRLEKQAKELLGFDDRLAGYAFYNPRTLKPFRKVTPGGKVTHSSDASKQILTSLECGLDAVVGVGTFEKYRLDRFNRMYETRVLTFGANKTPGTFFSVLDNAISSGYVTKEHVIVNKDMIDLSAQQMEALGISNCQKHYTFMNGDTHSEHAINISGALLMVQKMIKDNPDDHMDIVENLRAERRSHASNNSVFHKHSGEDHHTISTSTASIETSSPVSSSTPLPHDVSPI